VLGVVVMVGASFLHVSVRPSIYIGPSVRASVLLSAHDDVPLIFVQRSTIALPPPYILSYVCFNLLVSIT